MTHFSKILILPKNLFQSNQPRLLLSAEWGLQEVYRRDGGLEWEGKDLSYSPALLSGFYFGAMVYGCQATVSEG